MINQSHIVLPNGEVAIINKTPGYVITESGVFDEFNQNIKYASLCWVDASISFLDDNDMFKIIKGINQTTGTIFELHLSNSEFIADYKSTLLSQLLRKGVEIEYGEHKKILKYLSKQKPPKQLVAVKQMGWHLGLDKRMVYLRPDKIIGKTNPPLVLLNTEVSASHGAIYCSCSLEDEQKYVSDYCLGNPMLIFAMGIAFADRKSVV